MSTTITPEIKAAYIKYVAKQKQGRQRGWESEEMFAQNYEKYFQKDWGPNGDRVKKESVGLTTADRQRMLELAGIAQV